jgi:prevent-host-death family protein
MNYQSKRKRIFSTGDLSRHIGDVTHAASEAPVTITHHSKPRYILMSVEDFERMNPQRSYSVQDMPGDLAEAMIAAIDDFLSGKVPYDG